MGWKRVPGCLQHLLRKLGNFKQVTKTCWKLSKRGHQSCTSVDESGDLTRRGWRGGRDECRESLGKLSTRSQDLRHHVSRFFLTWVIRDLQRPGDRVKVKFSSGHSPAPKAELIPILYKRRAANGDSWSLEKVS